MKTFYFIGIYRDKKTIVLQATTNKDCLSCELIEYFGAKQTTKENLKRNKNILFQEFKKQYPYFKDCTKIRIE
jgi:hypothetical protein